MWWILSGIAAILGGSSGRFVLRGTNSTSALIIAGVVMIIIGIIQMATKGSKKPAVEPTKVQTDTLLAEIKNSVPLAEPVTITLLREPNEKGFYSFDYDIILNGDSVGKLKNGESISFTTTYKKNLITSTDFSEVFIFETGEDKIINLKFEQVDNNHIKMVSGGTVIKYGQPTPGQTAVVNQPPGTPQNLPDFCPKCGTKFETGQESCPKCGSSRKILTVNKERTGKGFAITSFVLGILCVLGCFGMMSNSISWEKNNNIILNPLQSSMPTISILFILSVIFGIISFTKYRRKLAFTGLILCGVSLILIIISVSVLSAKGAI